MCIALAEFAKICLNMSAK